MAQSHSGKLYKLVDPKRYVQEILLQIVSNVTDSLFREKVTPQNFLLQSSKLAPQPSGFHAVLVLWYII